MYLEVWGDWAPLIEMANGQTGFYLNPADSIHEGLFADRRMNSGHFTDACSGPLPERLDLVFRKTSHELISILVDIDNSVRPAGAIVRRKVYPVRRNHDTDAGKLSPFRSHHLTVSELSHGQIIARIFTRISN